MTLLLARAVVAAALAASSALPTHAQINSTEGGALIFQTNGTERARISDTLGNVGIGTTNPEAKLTVSGNVSVSGIIDVGHTAQACATAISGSIRYETTSDTLQICTSSGWKSLSSATTPAGSTSAASNTGAIQFNSGNSFAGDTSNLFWDDANNRLGVGTTAPSSTLHVVGSNGSPNLSSDATNVALLTSNNAVELAMGSITSGAYPFWIQTKHLLNAGTAYPLALNPLGGNVGIRTIAPGALLHIGDATNSLGTTAGDDLDMLTLQSDTSNTDSLFFTTERLSAGSDWTTAAHRIQRQVDATPMGYVQFGSYASDLITFGENATEYMRIDGTGNVGIRTTAPTHALQVSSSQTANAGVLVTGGTLTPVVAWGRYTSGQIMLGADAYHGGMTYDYGAGDLYIDNSYANVGGDIIFRTQTSGTVVSAVTITGAGNVYAGTERVRGIVHMSEVATTTGTYVDFTSIPSEVDRITVMFDSVSTNGGGELQIQLGTSSGIQTTGYVGMGKTGTGADKHSTSACLLAASAAASDLHSGAATFTRMSDDKWVMTASLATHGSSTGREGACRVGLSGTLDRLRISDDAGGTFDSGSISVAYE